MSTSYDPDDVRVSMAHTASSTGHDRIIGLDLERASDGAPIVSLSLSPEEFAAVIATRATVVRSSIPLASPIAPAAVDPSEWFRPGDRVYPRPGGQVVLVHQVTTIGRGRERQMFRASGEQVWCRTDDYQLCARTDSEGALVLRRVLSAMRAQAGITAADVAVIAQEYGVDLDGPGDEPSQEPCPDTAAHACVYAGKPDEGDCDGTMDDYRVLVAGTLGQRVDDVVVVCRNHADQTRPGALTLNLL